MRKIKYIFLHCTATSQNTKVASIQKYWKEVMGWKSPGYHYIIDASGYQHQLLSEDKIANGVKGYNSNSIHISYIGGVDSKGRAIDNRTEAQKQRQITLLTLLLAKYPDAKILGHRDVLQKGKPGYKDCPSFDVKSWLAEWKK